MERKFKSRGTVKTTKFVDNELVSLVNQLKNIDSNPSLQV